MRNLKLLNVQQEANIEADSFCFDFDKNIYFASANKVYCQSCSSKDVSLFAELESEVEKSHSVIGIEHLIECDKLFIVSSSGEIYLCDIYNKEVSTVGIVDSGIEGFAWSPDQEFLVILTGANTLILMTRDYDPVTEKSLCPDEFGESSPITVGWGSKETQFHGSEGKGAAQVKQIEPKPALFHDDKRPRISWRGDGEYFVTSSIHSTKGYRQLRIWSREAVLQFTGEKIEGLEEPVCWRPSGNLIACSQQHANKHKVVFFEKNGLQHGEFVLPFKPNTHKVTHLLWNSDSTVLLVVAELIEAPPFFQVMLWTCGNYHWYLKQSFCLPKKDNHGSLVTKWSSYHPQELFFLNQTSSRFYHANWAWTVSSSLGYNECDEAIVVSIDNDGILVTPFAKMLVPPPMSAYSYNLNAAVQSVCFAPSSSEFCCYLGNFNLAVFQRSSKIVEDNRMKLVATGGNGFEPKVIPYVLKGVYKLNLQGTETEEFGLCHWTWAKGNKLLCVCLYKVGDQKSTFGLLSFQLPENIDFKEDNSGEEELLGSIVADLECSVVGMCSNKSGLVAVQLSNKKILKCDIDEMAQSSKAKLLPWLCDDGEPLVLPQPCISISIISICGKDHFLGLTDRFVLYCNNTVILSNCTSYYIHDEYLLTTTTENVLRCFLINLDLANLKNLDLLSKIQTQKVEKGARIVIVPTGTTKVILQMPRGNLETIHPRPLVLSSVCKHLDKLQFDKAFELSKAHRIDLNILYDHNPKAFLDNTKLFMEQLSTTTNLNLFLTSLKNDDICDLLYALAYKGKVRPDKLDLETNKIDVISNAIRNVIEEKNDDKLFLTLIATYATKTERELNQALRKLKCLKDSNSKDSQAMVDTALNFLLYLVDVNELIDVALSTYDLEITIMVAQKSQKDPKEFLPFYNELQNMEENYRMYKIDMHLQRYKLALQHISKCEEHFNECLSLIKDQRLYRDALYLFPPSSDKYKVVWKEYGIYLMEKRHYDEAGLVFTRCEDYERALKAYKESLNWQSMLCAAMQLSYSDDRIISLCLETVEKLKGNQKYLDASYLLEQYIKDIEESIVTLIEGCEWNAALLLMSKYRRQDISETHFKPALQDHHIYLSSQIEQLSKDFTSHLDRLTVIRLHKKKESELPDIVKLHDEELFSETDSVTEVASSVAESKQMSGSIITKKSSKNKRKQKLKKYRLKEGSPDEDLAHIAALSEIVIKVDSLKDNFLNTLKTLVMFGLDNQAKILQTEMCNLVNMVESEIPNIWRPIDKEFSSSEMKYGPESTSNSITAQLKSDKANSVNSDPELAVPSWRKIDLSLQMFM